MPSQWKQIALAGALTLATAGSAVAQGGPFNAGDPEAATAQSFGRPTKSWSQWTPKPTYAPSELPDQYMGENRAGPNSEDQTGWNRCAAGKWNQASRCQTAWINSATDFCLFAPETLGTVGASERNAVAFCTTPDHGTRLIPDGTLQSVHFVRTSNYVQVTGKGDFTKLNVPAGDDGGEMDPHGADDLSNPIGAVLYTRANPSTNGQPFFVQEWTEFLSFDTYCMRACWGNDAAARCQHIYDVLGCNWNIPANYEAGVFETCDGDLGLIQGVYDGSTFKQGDPVTPSAHPVPSSSNCVTATSIANRINIVDPASSAAPSSSAASSAVTGAPAASGASSNAGGSIRSTTSSVSRNVGATSGSSTSGSNGASGLNLGALAMVLAAVPAVLAVVL